MTITATVENSLDHHKAIVQTEGAAKEISILAKSVGQGSSINGGELLFLALATCFCNDLYREAARRTIQIDSVKVHVTGEFGKEGEPGHNIKYQVEVQSPASKKTIDELIVHVDTVAEIHNTLRQGVSVDITTNA